MMPRPSPILTFSHWGGLIEAMRARRAQLGLTQQEVNLRAGLQDGYYSKLECPEAPGGRGIGPKTLARVLAVLGLKLAAIATDPAPEFEEPLTGGEATQRYQKKLGDCARSDAHGAIRGSPAAIIAVVGARLARKERNRIRMASFRRHPLFIERLREKERERWHRRSGKRKSKPKSETARGRPTLQKAPKQKG